MSVSAQYLPDAAGHIGTITINGNAQFTATLSVTLTLNAVDDGNGVALMQFSNDELTWSAPEPYATNKQWQLVDDGTYPPQMKTVLKTVFVKFRDGAGKWTPAVSDSIVLANSPAEIPQVKDVWLVQQLPPDYLATDPLGSQRNPYLLPSGNNEAQFDALLYSLQTNYHAYTPQVRTGLDPQPRPTTNCIVLTVHIGPGLYQTHGDCSGYLPPYVWAPDQGWRVLGAGKDVTTLKGVGLSPGYRLNVIGGNGDLDNVEVADLTLDANIQEGGTNLNGQLSQGISFCGSNLQIRRVKIKNSGSHQAGAEPAALNMQTFGVQYDSCNLVVEDCDLGYPQLGNAYRPNPMTISGQYASDGTMRYYRNVLLRNCYIDGTTFAGATPIDPNKNPWYERGNQALNIGGTWGAIIEDNLITNCCVGYYVDLATGHDLTLRNNHFRKLFNGAVMGLGTTSTAQTRWWEGIFCCQSNLFEFDPHFYTNGDTYGSFGWRACFNLTGDIKGPDDYTFNQIFITNNVFQFDDQRAPDANVAAMIGLLQAFRTAEVRNNSFRGIARSLLWDNSPEYLDQQVDLVDSTRSTPLLCLGNTHADGSIVECYPYVLDKNLPQPVLLAGTPVTFPAPQLASSQARVADGLPVAGTVDASGAFLWQPSPEDAGRYLVSFYDSTNRLQDPRRLLLTVLNRVPPTDAHYFANGLKAFWRFDDSTTTLADASGNGITLPANPAISAGLVTLGVAGPAASRKAAHFSGANLNPSPRFALLNTGQRLFAGFPVLYHPLLEGATSLYHSFSLAFWFKADSEPSRAETIFGYGRFACNLIPGTVTNDGLLAVSFVVDSSFGLTTAAMLPAGIWHHVVIVYDGVSGRMYVDGAQAATQLVGQITGFSSGGTMTFGGGIGWDNYAGALAEMAIWDRPLADAEVTRIYAEQAAGTDALLTPVAPSALKTQVAGLTATLTWQDDSSNESGFVLERSTDGTNFLAVASLSLNATSYTDLLPLAGIYYYRVKATNSQGDSPYSNLAAVGKALPPPPGSLRIQASY